MSDSDMMNEPEIDRIFSRQEEIVPSSGFTASVMDAVHREAAVPAPIPFPWRRAVPGLAVALVALALVIAAGVGVIVEISRISNVSGVAAVSVPMPDLWSEVMGRGPAGWTLLSLLLAFVSVKISMRLASGQA